MDWADELAAQVRDRGPQVVNDSKTPSGTVHVGSLRGPVILDTITRALRASGIETTLLYGVDDLDPMDAQALLTPDAVEHEMGRPLAHVPDQAGDGHASYARHHAQVFIDVFAGLGIHPDRYYWMSEIYPTGAMDPYLRIALDKAAEVREIYRRVANVQHPDAWHPAGVICPNCGKVGTTIVTQWDGEKRLLRVPGTPRRVGDRLRRVRLDLAVRRQREAALEPRMGRPVVAVRRDHRAVRQGPLDRGRVARPERRHRPRDLRARAAAQRAVRVPQHRRQEDVDLQGAWRRGAHDRRGDPAGAAPVPVPAPEAEPRHRVRPRRHRPDPAPLRRVRQVRRRDRWPRGQGRAAARLRGDLPVFAARPWRRRRCRSRRVPARVLAPRAARAGARRRRRGARRGGEGERPHRARGRDLRGAPSGGARLARCLRTRARRRQGPADRARPRPRTSDRRSGRSWRRSPRPPRMRVSRPAMPGRTRSSAPPASAGIDAKAAFTALYLAFLGRPNGPRAGWLLASMDETFVIDRLRAAGGMGVPA